MEAADFYASLMDRWHHVQKSLPKESYIEISFEKYVTDPEKVYKQICRHMGIEFQTSMLNVEILSSPVGKWKEKIDSNLHISLKDRLSNYMKRYDY
jgi:hypothetical protein